MKSSRVLTYMRQTIDAKGFTEEPFGQEVRGTSGNKCS